VHQVPMFVDGHDHEPTSGEWFASFDPYRGTVWSQVAQGSSPDVDLAVAAARAALRSHEWAGLTPTSRGALLVRLADVIAENAKRLAELEVRDNGKLYAEMFGQTSYLPQWFRYYGGLADKIEGRVVPVDKPGYFTFTRRRPVGVTAIITPWNSPLLLLAWKLAPALAAGCTVVVKPSEFTSASTVELARILHDAGLPPGVMNVVTGFGAEVGAPLVDHRDVAKISFTGSDATGRSIGAAAGGSLKHVSLELGGKSPNMVFEDADFDDAVNGVVSGIFAATGQTCIAGSRLLVHQSIHDEIVERIVKLSSTAIMGDPRDPGTQIGPITTQPQFKKVLEYIDIAKGEGATIRLGGRAADPAVVGDGWFIEPTIFTGVENSMRIAREEVFGPVLAVIPFDDEEEAVAIANDSAYGLGAGIWTKNMARAFRVSERIEAGTVWVNTYRAVSFMMPFGGVKDSGIGRENGAEAIDEYLETSSVWINTGAEVGNPFVLR
jgi:acyl-CoA reductase-like NAD-dependent aldehyde dehydrogenase